MTSHHSRDETSEKNVIPVPNNSLLVLSHCVDLMDRQTPRQPQQGWASAAAARRAHRAKVIRSRKPSLPPQSDTEAATGRDRASHQAQQAQDIANIQFRNGLSRLDGQRHASPPVHTKHDGSITPPDPQRSSSGSGNASEDAIAGFSSSDRPTVSDCGAGSGTGGSLDNSDAGDPEEEPKSSNDGSGDDGNRQSPASRDSSSADPQSSSHPSREHSPNESSTDVRNIGNASQHTNLVESKARTTGKAEHKNICVDDNRARAAMEICNHNEKTVAQADNLCDTNVSPKFEGVPHSKQTNQRKRRRHAHNEEAADGHTQQMEPTTATVHEMKKARYAQQSHLASPQHARRHQSSHELPHAARERQKQT